MIAPPSQRKMLAAVALALAAGYASDGGRMLSKPFTQRQETLDGLRRRREEQVAALRTRENQARQLQAWTREALPLEEAPAAALYYPYLAKLTEATGLRQVTIAPAAEQTATANARWWTLSVSAEGDSAAWADFFHRFQETSLLQRVASWEFLPTNDSLLRGNLVLEVACLRGSPENAAELTIPEPAAHLSTFAARDWFQDRRVAATPEPAVEEPVQQAAATEPVAPEREPSPPLKLVGTLISDARREAWFYEPVSGKQLVVEENSQVQLSADLGTVAAVDGKGVQIVVHGNPIRVAIGEFSP